MSFMNLKGTKRILSLMLSLVIVLSLCACQRGENPEPGTTGSETATTTAEIPTTEAPTEVPTTEENLYYEVTVHFHYVRVDQDYTPWDVWMWTTSDGKGYAFTEAADENGVALTATFAAGTESIGYIVRQQDWTKDVGEDQFIDLSSIYGGTVEVYVVSGVKGARVEFQSDCKKKAESETTTAATNLSEAETHDTTGWVAYNYTQDLNIIEDNYRNYYEIFVYSFCDSDGDGIGDFNGITSKLDYIAELGFNALWLMPIMAAPSYHKYDTTDFYSVDPAYGTTEDFKKLLEEAHKRNITVTIDFVINHTSNEHPWFKEAVAYLKTLGAEETPDVAVCPYVDYYHFTRNATKGTQISGTNWYYESEFSSTQPDLNLSNESLRKEMEAVSKYWIELGVDGFRMDAAMHYEEADNTFNCEVLSWIYQYCCSLKPDFYMVSEVWTNRNGFAAYYASETPSIFNFDTSGTDGLIEKTVKGNYGAKDFVERLLEYQTLFSSYYANYIDAVFITNHDQVRVANNLNFDENKLKLAAGLMMIMNGSTFVYYGEEIGMKSSGTSDENKRVGMYWSQTDTTGSCRGPQNATSFDQYFAPTDVQLTDEGSLLNYYKRALRLRNENPELARGTITMLENLCDAKQAAFTKNYQGSTIGVVLNVSDAELTIDLSGTELATMAIRGYLVVNGEEVKLNGTVLTLPAQSICILK